MSPLFRPGGVLQGSFIGGRPRLGAPGGPVVQQRGNAVEIPTTALTLGARAGGQPLPEAVRQQMEAALGARFADVRVHVGPEAAAIGALAFAHGSDLYFAPGHYAPNTPQGRRLLGHELAHVVQQRQGRVRNPFGSGVAVVQDPALEAEAERLGVRAASLRVGPAQALPPPVAPAARRGAPPCPPPHRPAPVQRFPAPPPRVPGVPVPSPRPVASPVPVPAVLQMMRKGNRKKIETKTNKKGGKTNQEPRHRLGVPPSSQDKIGTDKKYSSPTVYTNTKRDKQTQREHVPLDLVWTPFSKVSEHAEASDVELVLQIGDGEVQHLQKGEGNPGMYRSLFKTPFSSHNHEIDVSKGDGEVDVLPEAFRQCKEDLDDHPNTGEGRRHLVALLGPYGPCDGCKERIKKFKSEWQRAAVGANCAASLVFTYFYRRPNSDQRQATTTYGYNEALEGNEDGLPQFGVRKKPTTYVKEGRYYYRSTSAHYATVIPW